MRSSLIRLADGALCSLTSPTQSLGDFSHSMRDTPTHVAQLEAEIHARLRQSPHRAAKYADHVLAQPAVGRMMDRRLDDGGVHAHLLALGHPGRCRDGHQSVQQLAQRGSVDDLSPTNHGLRGRDLACIDPAEAPVYEASGHLPFQLGVAPVAQVLESQHPQHHLGRRARAASPGALPPPLAHHRHHRLDDLLVLERLVDFPEPGLHQQLGLGQHEAEQNHLRQLELGVSSSDIPTY
jgi:hypothetical protein